MFDLVNAIVDGTEPPTSGADNLNTMCFCLATLKSVKEKRIVGLEEVD